MTLFREYQPKQMTLFSDWEADAERKRRARTLFAQESIKVDEVARELAAVQRSVGGGADLAAFLKVATEASGGTVTQSREP